MRVAVLRALGFGDLLTAVPALRALRRRYPTVVLGTPLALAPLVGLIGADLQVAGVGPFLGVPPAGPLPPAMYDADLAVNLHGAGPQSTALLTDCRPRRLVAFGRTSIWQPHEHEVWRWCRLLTEAGLPADPADLGLSRPMVAPSAPGAVVLHPGAAYGARRWPADRWTVLARSLAADGHRVVLTGGPAEVRLAADVAAAAGLSASAVLAGRTPLLTLAATIADAALLVCGDTGVAHLATAYAVPSVLIFGPTSPQLWGPPPRRQHRVLWAGESSDPNADLPAAGLLAVSSTDVLAAARALVAG